MKHALAALSALAALLLAAPLAIAQPAPTARLTLEPAAAKPGDIYPLEAFGINWNWLESGGGVVEHGELVRDRSFRNQGEVMARAWVESPGKEARGRIEHVDKGGDERPWAGKGYPGYMKLSQQAPGYTCLSQRAIDVAEPGYEYEVHLSARALAGQPGLSVFLADGQFMPIEPVDKTAFAKAGAWQDHRFVLKPTKREVGPFVRVCLATAGEVAVDEIRVRRLGGSPRFRAAAAARIKELGVRSLRWPTGSDADHFDWREAIGPLQGRGENPSDFKVYETPSAGMHEFLDFCESTGIVPLVTVNVLLPPESAAAQVEYILGPESTPMGALRARHGRAAPWKVRHFELGNEPVERYRGEFGRWETAKGYAAIATSVGAAMKARARALGATIELKAVAETTFALSDWIGMVPMLSRWNGVVLDRKAALRSVMDQPKGHFYSAFTWIEDERELWEEVLGGGATIAATVRKLDREYGPLAPFWLTEYAVMIQKDKRFFGADIQLDRAKDFQAGLAAADLLVTAMRERFGGAYLFNLSQWGTWGVMANATDFRLRPSGLAFSMLTPFAGETRVPLRLEGGREVRLTRGKGNHPKDTRYNTLSAVAARGARTLQVAILNRGYEGAERLAIDTGGLAVLAVEVHQLGPEKPTAGNDTVDGTVRVKRRSLTAEEARVVDIPPRSLTRIVYSLR